MRKLLIGFFVIAMVMSLSILSSDGLAAKKIIEMKIASPFGNGPTNGYYPEWLTNELRRRGLADGQLKVRCYSSAQLGGEMELINKLRAGAIHLTINSFQVMSGFDVKAALGLLPFLLDTDEKVEKFFASPMAQEVAQAFEDKGLKNLGFLKFGRFTMAGSKPIRTPDDLKGIKIRVAESPVQLEIMRSMGIEPTAIPWVEVYEALKRKVVDGLDMAIEPIWVTKMYEVTKYCTQTSHVYGLNFVFTNKKWFDGLPPDVQEFITDAVQDIADLERILVLKREAQAVRDFKRKGIEIISLTDEQKKPFIKMGLTVHKKYVDQIGRDLVKRTYDLLDFPFADEVLGN